MDTTFNFETALSTMKNGGAVTRKGWNGRGLSARLQRPDENSKMSKPYFYLTAETDTEIPVNVPWIPSQTDLMAEDWEGVA